VRSDSGFREEVAFAPLARDVLCLEPYSCPTYAFNLEARGTAAAVTKLELGREWRGSIENEARTDHDHR
jgi:galactose mutarotase-like enzyme